MSVVVPVRGASARVRVQDGALVEEGSVPAPLLAPCACAGAWVAWVDGDDLVVQGADGDCQRLQTPNGQHVACLALAGDVLFVGGHNDGSVESIGWFDLAERPRRWRSLPIPPEIASPGKSIDDLVLDGGRLIAVDDFIMPKWLAVYDVADPRAARLVDCRRLHVHSSSEVVVAAALGGRWFATFSMTQNHGRRARNAAVYTRDTLEHRASMSIAEARWLGPERPIEHGPWWYGVAVVGDRLLLAAGEHGVGVADPERMELPARYVVPPGVTPGPIGPLHERRGAPDWGVRRLIAAGDDLHLLVVHGPLDALDTMVLDVRAL